MEILSDPTPDMLAMPRFDDGAIVMQELLRRLAEQVVNAVMDAEADQLRRPPDAGLHARSRLLAAQAPRGQDRLAGVPRPRRRHRDGNVPRGVRHAGGVLPQGGGGAGGGIFQVPGRRADSLRIGRYTNFPDTTKPPETERPGEAKILPRRASAQR